MAADASGELKDCRANCPKVFKDQGDQGDREAGVYYARVPTVVFERVVLSAFFFFALFSRMEGLGGRVSASRNACDFDIEDRGGTEVVCGNDDRDQSRRARLIPDIVALYILY